MTPQELVAAALEARTRAYAPYSHYFVGAALLAGDGTVILGCNVENAAYPSTICAERVALTAAVAQGKRDFVAIAVATANGGSPCGTCRQVMAELGLDMTVYISDAAGSYRTTSVRELLPELSQSSSPSLVSRAAAGPESTAGMSSSVPTLLATYQLRQREFLLRITRAMTSRLDLPSLLELILRSAAEMVGCPAGMILLQPQAPPLDSSIRVAPRFQVRAVYHIPLESLRAFAPLLDVTTLAALHEAALERGDDSAPPSIDLTGKVREVEETLGEVLGQVIALPLLFENEMLGVIYLFRGNYAFTQLDWQFLQGFADQAAIAVRNASLVHLLETERTRLATILENSADGIMILSADRQVMAVNQALANMVGMAAEDAVGRACGAVLPLENITGNHLCQDEAYSSQTLPAHASCEGELAQPGKRRIVAVTYTPLLGEDGRLLNIIVNVHDITRFREEEEMKSTFTSIISHELKTPVALIKGYAQTLARPDAKWDADTARQGLEIIEEEADRLEGLINNLLDVSRIAASGLKLDLGDVDLEQLARRVAEAYRTQTDHHSIVLDFAARLPLVWGDEERLRQVLTNLVSNAIKYSPDGGMIRIGGWLQAAHADAVPVDKSLTGAAAEDTEDTARVVMFVADQGVGIPHSELVNIFDRFYRVDSTLRRTTAGAGLGLFLSRAIVEAHGGRIWATSEPGRGTTIFFTVAVSA